MRRVLLAGAAVSLVLSSSLVLAQRGPKSLLPGFDEPSPAPSPAPAQTRAPAPSATAPAGRPAGAAPAEAVPGAPALPAAPIAIPSGLPSLDQIEKLDPDQLDEMLGLKPRYDIPPAARRSMERVGVLASYEGGLPEPALANQPAAIVRAALRGMRGPVVSRWGHILLRRALASRLEAPAGMDPAEFAGLRARALNLIGEYAVARALVQDVDTGNWDAGLIDAGLTAYLGTADVTGACPVIQLQGSARDDAQWQLWRSICRAYGGETARARSELNRALRVELAPPIDVLLAQRYAGAAGAGGGAVTLEWDDVDQLTPWRLALAGALGAKIPQALLDKRTPYLDRAALANPAMPLGIRIRGAEAAARSGILSAAAAVDLYSEVYAENGISGDAPATAASLREAYVAGDPAARLAAMREIWGTGADNYGRYVLTAYAAARITPQSDLSDDAPQLIASMLSAGLDADALSWAQFAPQGSEAWALLALAQPQRANPVNGGQVDTFVGADASQDRRKSAFLVAGLAGLGRLDDASRSQFDGQLAMGLERQTRWSQLIDRAAAVDNKGLVALLAGVGMQGTSWNQMTARHLFHIVRALDRVGLSAEARMIAAEAVARG